MTLPHGHRLESDLFAMCGVWLDELRAFDARGVALEWDDAGGVPGAFPYSNLVYVDFDGSTYRQTNVAIEGRDLHERTFHANVAEGVLRFESLGPQAPEHVGVSGGPGLIWFVAEDLAAAGLQRYSEPDLIRLEGDRRWRNTVLWRHGALARTLQVEGSRLSSDTSRRHERDPRGPDGPVHAPRSVTTHYTAGHSAVENEMEPES
jgi:hypothetical protein